MSLGRAATNDIILEDDTVSRQHAKIKLEGNQWFIYDLAATNPTRVNGRSLQGRHPLVDGDRIQIGNTVFMFKQVNR